MSNNLNEVFNTVGSWQERGMHWLHQIRRWYIHWQNSAGFDTPPNWDLRFPSFRVLWFMDSGATNRRTETFSSTLHGMARYCSPCWSSNFLIPLTTRMLHFLVVCHYVVVGPYLLLNSMCPVETSLPVVLWTPISFPFLVSITRCECEHWSHYLIVAFLHWNLAVLVVIDLWSKLSCWII